MLYVVPIRAARERRDGCKVDSSVNKTLSTRRLLLARLPAFRHTQNCKEEDKLHRIPVEPEAHRLGVEDRADQVPFGCTEPCGREEARKRDAYGTWKLTL